MPVTEVALKTLASVVWPATLPPIRYWLAALIRIASSVLSRDMSTRWPCPVAVRSASSSANPV